MLIMPEPYVTSATITGGKIVLSVRLDEFKPNEYVEISGQATQINGAFAYFYDIQQVPAEPNVLADPSVPNDTDHYDVDVTGAPSPHQFRGDQDVSVVARVARVWLTVLGGQPSQTGSGQGDAAPDGATWKEKRVSQINGSSW
jgi:hypothetical protein